METIVLKIEVDAGELKRLLNRDVDEMALGTLKENIDMFDVAMELKPAIQGYVNECLDNFVDDAAEEGKFAKFIED